jgi:hypothetical protein
MTIHVSKCNMYVIGYSHPEIQFIIIIAVKQEEKEHNKSLCLKIVRLE